MLEITYLYVEPERTFQGSNQKMTSRTTVYDLQSGETPVLGIVRSIADVTETDPESLPPIIESIDPEAVNRLYSVDDRADYPRLTFTHAGYLVTIDRTRTISIQEIQ
jgi:hypothetical protein